MQGTKANLVCVDPPYLVSLESASGKIKNDDLNDAEGYDFIAKALDRLAENMALDASIYMFHADSKGLLFRRAFNAAGFHLGATVIWKKDQLVLTRGPTSSTCMSRFSTAG
jgi:DNA modification methylase